MRIETVQMTSSAPFFIRKQISSRLKTGCSDALVSGIAFPNARRLPAAANSGVSRPYEPAEPVLPLCARRPCARRQIKKYVRSRKISTATNPTIGLAQMPLVHCSDPYEVKRSVGVRFIMTDASDLSKRVTCLVTYAALQAGRRLVVIRRVAVVRIFAGESDSDRGAVRCDLSQLPRKGIG
jgi:hypothetical protein